MHWIPIHRLQFWLSVALENQKLEYIQVTWWQQRRAAFGYRGSRYDAYQHKLLCVLLSTSSAAVLHSTSTDDLSGHHGHMNHPIFSAILMTV